MRMDSIAQSAGFQTAAAIEDMAELETFRPSLHDVSTGPRFARIGITPESPERILPPRDGVFMKNRFRQHLGLPVT